jgi:hypothetical protein
MADPINDDPKVITPEDIDPVAFAGLTLLRRLVTVLLGVMIVGFLVLIGLLVTRFSTIKASITPTISYEWPENITLPAGAQPQTFTRGGDWIGIVVKSAETDQDEILIFDQASGALRQTVALE